MSEVPVFAYRASRGLRWCLGVLLALVVLTFGFDVVYRGFRWDAAQLYLPFIAILSVVVVNTLTFRLTLSDEVLELRTWRGVRRIARSDILGFRRGVGLSAYVFVPKAPATRPLRMGGLVALDYELLPKGLAALTDLDAQDRAASLAAHREEFDRRLPSADQKRLLAVARATLLGLGLLSLVLAYFLAMAPMRDRVRFSLFVVWLAGTAAVAITNPLKFSLLPASATDPRMPLGLVMIMPSLGMSARSLLSTHADVSWLVAIGVGIGVLVAALPHPRIPRDFRAWEHLATRAFVGTVVIGTLAVSANVMLDSARPSRLRVTVASPCRIGVGYRPQTGFFAVAPWRPGRGIAEFKAAPADCAALQPGDSIHVLEHPGALGAAWVYEWWKPL